MNFFKKWGMDGQTERVMSKLALADTDASLVSHLKFCKEQCQIVLLDQLIFSCFAQNDINLISFNHMSQYYCTIQTYIQRS